MLGPVSNEDEGAGWDIGCVRALSLVSRVLAGAGAVGGVMCGTWWCSCVVSAARVSELSGVGPHQLQDVRLCLLEVVEGAEQSSLDAGYVLFREVGLALGGGVWDRPQQRHVTACHHVQAELEGGWGEGGWFPCGSGGLVLKLSFTWLTTYLNVVAKGCQDP